MTVEEIEEEIAGEAFDTPGSLALVDRLGDWALIVEPLGGEGIRPEASISLSVDGGRAFSAFSDFVLDVRVDYGENGEPVSLPADPTWAPSTARR